MSGNSATARNFATIAAIETALTAPATTATSSAARKTVSNALDTIAIIRASIGSVWDLESMCATSHTEGSPRIATRYAERDLIHGIAVVPRLPNQRPA